MATSDGDGRAAPAGERFPIDVGNLLPAWLAERLAAGPGRFGFLLVTGHVIVVDAIRQVRRTPGEQVWIDVEFLIPFKKDGFPWGYFPLVKRSSEERALSSINAAHVVAVVEVDTWEVPPLQPSEE